MKLSEVFRRVLELVGKPNMSNYICVIIRHEVERVPAADLHRALDVIYERINDRKRPNSTASGDALEHWLKQRGIKNIECSQMVDYRKRWLKELVKEFEAKGD